MSFVGKRFPKFGKNLSYYVAGSFFVCTSFFSIEAAPIEVRNVVARMKALRVFKANIRFGRGGSMVSGVFSYQNGKSHFKLSDGRVIAGNGRNMVAFSPTTRTAGKQTMVMGGSGLSWILSGFAYKVFGSRAIGKTLNPDAKIQEIKIAWGSNYLLRKLSVKYKGENQWFTMSLSNVRTLGGFPSTLFSFRPPSGSRTVENPLDQRN